MTQTVLEPRQEHMGLPLPNGKLAMWIFLVTEIMFFTALIGVYLILRNGTPSKSPFHWPAPHEVHLVEWIGALNTRQARGVEGVRRKPTDDAKKAAPNSPAPTAYTTPPEPNNSGARLTGNSTRQ